MSKIAAWSRNSKINFNEDKSRVMIILKRKRKESKEINVYLNNKPLQQVSTMKNLGIVIEERGDKCFVLLTQYRAGDKIKKNEMGWACGAYG